MLFKNRTVPIFLVGVLVGCAPTYPYERAAEEVKRLCRQEYGIDVLVKIQGDTIGVFLPLERFFETPVDLDSPKGILDLLTGNVRLAQEVGEKLDDVMLSTTRVVLSTDRPLQFYVVLAIDRKTGAGISLTRYVEDIKRFMLGDISRGDFINRMLLEMRYYPQTQFAGEEFPLEAVQLSSFLAQQIAQRMKTRLESHSPVILSYQISEVRGAYLSPTRRFAFFIDAEPMSVVPDDEAPDRASAILPLAREEAATILRRYRFHDFDAVLFHLGGDLVVVSRAELESSRRRWPWSPTR